MLHLFWVIVLWTNKSLMSKSQQLFLLYNRSEVFNDRNMARWVLAFCDSGKFPRAFTLCVCVCFHCGQSLALFLYFSVLVTEKRWEKYLQSYPAWSKVIRLKYGEASWQFLACPWCLEFHNKMFRNVEGHWKPYQMIQTSYFYRPSKLKEKKK